MIEFLLGVATVFGSFMLGAFTVRHLALRYRRRWKEAIALIETLSVDDTERKRQWEKERLLRPPAKSRMLTSHEAMAIMRRIKKENAA